MNKVVFINSSGQVVPESESTHKVTLNGNYYWSHYFGIWVFGVKKIEPHIPLSEIISKEFLLDNATI